MTGIHEIWKIQKFCHYKAQKRQKISILRHFWFSEGYKYQRPLVVNQSF